MYNEGVKELKAESNVFKFKILSIIGRALLSSEISSINIQVFFPVGKCLASQLLALLPMWFLYNLIDNCDKLIDKTSLFFRPFVFVCDYFNQVVFCYFNFLQKKFLYNYFLEFEIFEWSEIVTYIIFFKLSDRGSTQASAITCVTVFKL